MDTGNFRANVPAGVLTIDVGGSHVKIKLSNGDEKRSVASGASMNAAGMVEAVKALVGDWQFDKISIGYPGPVLKNIAASDPHNLGPGWAGFDFEEAFGKPVRMVNDALMQAMGGYKGGKMLFIGLGTGLGSAMIVEKVCIPLELAHLPYKKKRSFEDYVGERGLQWRGKTRWQKTVAEVVETLRTALQADYVVIGGGNAKKLAELPANASQGSNENAFLGGFRMWLENELVF